MNGETFGPTTNPPRSSYLQNTLSVIAANVLGGVTLFLANVLLARYFSVEDYGTYKIITSFFIFLFGITDLGVNITLIKYISQYRTEGTMDNINLLLRSLLKVKLLSHALFILLIVLLARPISVLLFHNASNGTLVILGTTIILFAIFETPKVISLGFQRYRDFTLSTFLTFAISGVLTILGAYWAGLAGAIIGFALGYLLGNLPSTTFVLRNKLLARRTGKLDSRSIFLRYSLPILLTVIPNSLGNAYIPLLSPFFSQTLIGYYGFTLTFYAGIYLVLQSLYQLMLTRSAAVQGHEQTVLRATLIRSTSLFYAGFALVGIAGIAIFARPLINVVNPTYLDGLNIFRWFLSAELCLGFFVVLSGYWSGIGKIRRALSALVVYNMLLFGLSYVLLSISR